MSISQRVKQLIDYAVKHQLIEESDRIFMTNVIMGELCACDFDDAANVPPAPLDEILSSLCDHAIEQGIIGEDTLSARDLFDTKLVGLLYSASSSSVTPTPSLAIAFFRISLAAYSLGVAKRT